MSRLQEGQNSSTGRIFIPSHHLWLSFNNYEGDEDNEGTNTLN